MKADPFQVGDVLREAKRFVVPIYQRTYDWDIDKQLSAFWTQIEAKADERLRNEARFPHYMGALLLIPRGGFSFGRMPVFDVVDGQQRLTTFQVLLIALRNLADESGDAATAQLLSSFLMNPQGPQLHERLERYKLLPTLADRQIYLDLVDLSTNAFRAKYPTFFYKNGNVHSDAPRLVRACDFFSSEAKDYIASASANGGDGLRALSAALLEDFKLIVITLDEQQDDAQVIFETLNAGGKELAAMDLVRNDVFHRALRVGEEPEILMEQRWKIFEEDSFWKELGTRGRIKKPRIDFFLSDMLAAETGDEILLTELYAYYKRFVRLQAFPTVDSELEALLRHTATFKTLLQPIGEGALQTLGRNLSLLDVTTAYPLVFVVAASAAPDGEKAGIYALIASYIVRRLLCGLTAKNYNKVFPQIATKLRTSGVTLEMAREAFRALTGDTQRFPDDMEFTTAILTRPQYTAISQRRLQYVLAELERASRTAFHENTIVPEGLTIEHVLPNEWRAHWPLADGSKAATDLVTGMTESQAKAIADREAIKHTLGNLTLLTGTLNPSISNLPFSHKREQLRSQSLLRLNQEIAELPDWNEERIRARSSKLAARAITIWPNVDSL